MSLAGKSIDRYRIMEQLGRGGMAVVYKGYDTRLEREVAVKVIRKENILPSQYDKFLARFEREAKAQARFTHANIVKVYDFGDYEGSPYLVMEYHAGGTLKERMGEQIPYAEAASMLLPIADALAYSHELDILHRDIKPGNILVSRSGELVLTDFGIAKLLGDQGGMTLTGTGMGVGTPEYMAPEQWVGDPVPQSDIYGVGVVLYEMITGEKPYSADTPPAVAIMQITEPLPLPSKFVSDLPDNVEKILLKALAVKPENRFETMAEFVGILRRVAQAYQPEVQTPAEQAPTDSVPVPQKPAPQVEEVIKEPSPSTLAPPPEIEVEETYDVVTPAPMEPVVKKPEAKLKQLKERLARPKRQAQPARDSYLPEMKNLWWVVLGIAAAFAVAVFAFVVWQNSVDKPFVSSRNSNEENTALNNSGTNAEEPADVDEAAPTPTQEEGVITEEPANIDEATPQPTQEEVVVIEDSERSGAWVDQVVMSVVYSDTAVTQLEAGAIDIFGSALRNPAQFSQAKDAGMDMAMSQGMYYDLTINPAEFSEGFNPFSDGRIRQAMNWLIDREYIVQEVFGGTGMPRYMPITPGFPDYVKYAETARQLEAEYAYDFDRAEAQITEAMLDLGAQMVNGTWTYGGDPVEIIFLIRNDSDGTRVPIGDYIANQLEAIGFLVNRQYKTISEVSPLWFGSDPHEGLWHLYTGAWADSEITRDEGYNFQFFYTSDGLEGVSLWESYVEHISDEFYEVADALAYGAYSSAEERAELFTRAMALTFEEEQNFRIWLLNGVVGEPRSLDISVSAGLATGVYMNPLWPFTLRYDADEGGLVRWGTPDLFVDPANPVSGSTWSYDIQWMLATNDAGVFLHPENGLALPQRIERAEVTVLDDLLVTATYDWVDLSFASEIQVPAGTWVDWDAARKTFITTNGSTTAKVKSVVYYPDDLFATNSWHDGSPLSAADFVMNMIMYFERGKEASPIYDENAAADLDYFMSSFKGFRIISADPLIIEYYTDEWFLDAEANVYPMWPNYGTADAAWHVISVGNAAEAAGELAYSYDKADQFGVEWMNLLGGRSLDILSAYLDELNGSGTIPYAQTMGDYVSYEEATARYANLQAFYGDYGHFWVGTGPFILDEVYLVEKTLTLTRNEAYPDASDKWASFSE